jgi:hypothetical protein
MAYDWRAHMRRVTHESLEARPDSRQDASVAALTQSYASCVDFFEPPPPQPQPPPPPRYRPPEWSGPPENVVPGIVPLELVLANTDRLAVWIGHAEAYPNGLTLTVLLCGREPAEPGAESGEGTWRFGVQFSDERKATVYGLGALAAFSQQHGASTAASAVAIARTPSDPPPDAPLLLGRGGGGSRNKWRQDYWLWPLPPSGELVIACEWPNLDLPLTVASVDADAIREAAGRAKELWRAEDLPEWPGSSAHRASDSSGERGRGDPDRRGSR